jgi:hypothetical protein
MSSAGSAGEGSDEAPPPLPPAPPPEALLGSIGNAAWVYDAREGGSGIWADMIDAYNRDALPCSRIDTVFSYGGSMELYEELSPPGRTYFGERSQMAADAYHQKGLKVIAVVDGRMDARYGPDLRKLNASELSRWADSTAKLYCAHDFVSGIQIDLEPMDERWVTELVVFVGRLATSLRDAHLGCVNDAYPQGRLLAVFGPPSRATAAMWSALGPNGFYVVSGYDMADSPPGDLRSRSPPHPSYTLATFHLHGVPLVQVSSTTSRRTLRCSPAASPALPRRPPRPRRCTTGMRGTTWSASLLPRAPRSLRRSGAATGTSSLQGSRSSNTCAPR